MTGPNAKNPQVVADAIVALVEAPGGQWPLRTVAGSLFAAPAVAEGDDPYAEHQKQLLIGIGAERMLRNPAAVR